MVNMFGSRILVFGEKVNGYRGMNDPDSFALFLGGEQDILTFADWRDRRRVGLRKNGFRDIRSYFGVNERMGFALSRSYFLLKSHMMKKIHPPAPSLFCK